MLRKSRGFTLIELLVVIAIIAILAAILFPVFLSAKKSANAGACLSNMKELAMAQLMYAQDNSGYIARSTSCPSTVNDPFYMDGYIYISWMSKIFNLVKSTKAFPCPGDPMKGIPGYAGVPTKYPIGYAMWQWASEAGQDPRYGTLGATRWKGSTSQITKPTRIIMLMENYRGVPNGGPWWIGYAFAEAKKHGSKNNYAFYDGHVKAFKMIETVSVSNNMWNHLDMWPAMIPMQDKWTFASAQEMHDYAVEYIERCRQNGYDVQE